MRTELLSSITSAVSTLTQFAVATELPWEQNGKPLFHKNMKRIYVDQEYKKESTMMPTLDFNNVIEDNLITNVYLTCDAKNPPTQLNAVISKILAAKDATNVVNFQVESDYTVDKQEDVLTFTFEFRFDTIQQ